MYKKSILILLTLVFIGCNYINNPQTLLKDPHFTQYKNNRDNLEKKYLRKEISYADYVQKRDELDLQYDKEVKDRNSKIEY